jgi:Spx/MgsR family transcriptional regulator
MVEKGLKMTVQIYGIKNCDTMKKAFHWLENHHVSYEFHDYKKEGADRAVLEQAFESHGWENVINRKGMTWRKLSDDVKETMNKDNAMTLAMEKPSVIKRPILIKDNMIELGFDARRYEDIFK